MSFNANGSGNYHMRSNGPQHGQSFRYNNANSSTNVGNTRTGSVVNKNNQLYMGDLDSHWDDNTIKHIWASLGERNVDVKIMWNNNANNNNGSMGLRSNLGYCFVEFPSNAHASNALLKNGIPIPDHPSKSLRLNWASSSHSNASGAFNDYSVFVGDLAPNVNESQLFELFIGRFPSTSHAKVVYDQATGVSKGYAFIRFGNSGDQQRALLEMQGVFLNGRAIRVSSAGHQHQQNVNSAVDNKTRSLPGSNSNPTSSGNNANSSISSSQFMFPVQQQPPLTSFTDPNNTTVFIGGLSGRVTEDDLRAFFQPFGTIVYVKIPAGKGCGFVQYVDRISAETAIAKMQGFPMGGSRIRLSWGRSAKQAASIQQASINNVLQQQQQQLQQPQPTLQQPTFAYIPSSSYNPPSKAFFFSTYEEIAYMGRNKSPSSNSSLNYPASSLTTPVLLPGYQNMTYSEFPPSASGLQSNYDNFPKPMLPAQGQAIKDGQADTSQPQIVLQSNEMYVNNKNASMDRLERGSNGFVFA